MNARFRQLAMKWNLAAIVATLLVAGCSKPALETVYGRRSGTHGGPSVNGTAVLADLFEQAGFDVSRKSRLSPAFERYNTVVWAPDDFDPPSEEVHNFFDEWLAAGRNRTLVYIGRDYDAAIDYWEQAQATAPPEQAVEVIRRLATARAEHDRRRAAMSADAKGKWFRVLRDRPKQLIGRRSPPTASPPTLSGDWAGGDLDPTAVDIELASRSVPLETSSNPGETRFNSERPLLTAGDEMLAFEVSHDFWSPGSKVIVIANGSFLLNLPLVNAEHRKLASRLIADCGPPGNTVFLESGESGPPILDRDGADYPTGLEMFTVWPMSIVMLHFLAVGILAILAQTSIFGRPRELPPPPVSDFRKHILALGQLLARTKNTAYAQSRVRHYFEQVKRESGATHQDQAGGK